MKVSVLNGIRSVAEEERPIPAIGDTDVLIQVMDCTVCGSDVHYYEFGRIGDFVVEKPMVLGHECAGRIVKLGAGVSRLKIGDLVAVEPGYTCGKCEFCKSGRYNLCKDVVFLATPPYDGAFAEYLRYPSDMVYKLPGNMDTIEGALLEPFCVGLQAVRRSGAAIGNSAVILGAGCIGLCTMLALQAAGIREIYVVDMMEKRLAFAKELGATAVINPGETDSIEALMRLTGGRGTDLVFEAAGNRITTQQTVHMVKRGGTVTLIGMAPNPVFELDFGALQGKEANLHTVFRYCNLYPTAIDVVSRCRVPLKKLITNSYGFEGIPQALEDNIVHKKDMIKALIHISD